MTMSTQCKWISFFVMSMAVILLLLLFYSLESKNRCPNEGELMWEETGECYMKDSQGPCHNDLIFSEYEPRSSIGSCSCPYMYTNRTMLYHNGHCYYIFSQAYCPDGHWLNVTAAGEPICEMNRCLQHSKNGLEDEKNANDDGEIDMKSSDQYDHSMHEMNNGNHSAKGLNRTTMETEWVPIQGGRCAQLMEHAEGCPEGSVVRFHPNVILPSCFDPPKRKKLGQSLGAIGVAAYTSCPLGSYRSIMGRCQPTFDFDFEDQTVAEESSELPKK